MQFRSNFRLFVLLRVVTNLLVEFCGCQHLLPVCLSVRPSVAQSLCLSLSWSVLLSIYQSLFTLFGWLFFAFNFALLLLQCCSFDFCCQQQKKNTTSKKRRNRNRKGRVAHFECVLSVTFVYSCKVFSALCWVFTFTAR